MQKGAEGKKAGAKSPKKSPARTQKREASDDEVEVVEDRKPAAKKSPKKSARREAFDSDDEVEVMEDRKPAAKKPPKSPKKQQRTAPAAEETAPRRSTRSRTVATQTEPIAIDSDYESDDAEVRNMDWEKTDENEPPSSSSAQGKGHLNLEIVEGPHEGTVVPIGGHHKDTIVVGRDPKSNSKSKDAVGVALSNDESASSLHVKFNIVSKKTVHSVKVTDMSSTNGTFVNGANIGKGKSRQAFPGDKIKIGETVFEIKRCWMIDGIGDSV